MSLRKRAKRVKRRSNFKIEPPKGRVVSLEALFSKTHRKALSLTMGI